MSAPSTSRYQKVAIRIRSHTLDTFFVITISSRSTSPPKFTHMFLPSKALLETEGGGVPQGSQSSKFGAHKVSDYTIHTRVESGVESERNLEGGSHQSGISIQFVFLFAGGSCVCWERACLGIFVCTLCVCMSVGLWPLPPLGWRASSSGSGAGGRTGRAHMCGTPPTAPARFSGTGNSTTRATWCPWPRCHNGLLLETEFWIAPFCIFVRRHSEGS